VFLLAFVFCSILVFFLIFWFVCLFFSLIQKRSGLFFLFASPLASRTPAEPSRTTLFWGLGDGLGLVQYVYADLQYFGSGSFEKMAERSTTHGFQDCSRKYTQTTNGKVFFDNSGIVYKSKHLF